MATVATTTAEKPIVEKTAEKKPIVDEKTERKPQRARVDDRFKCFCGTARRRCAQRSALFLA